MPQIGGMTKGEESGKGAGLLSVCRSDERREERGRPLARQHTLEHVTGRWVGRKEMRAYMREENESSRSMMRESERTGGELAR